MWLNNNLQALIDYKLKAEYSNCEFLASYFMAMLHHRSFFDEKKLILI